MKNFILLLCLAASISACSVDSLDSHETDLLTTDFAAQQSLDQISVQGIPIVSFDLIHEQGQVKGTVHVTNDCDNLYVQVTGEGDEANLGIYEDMADFPKKNGAQENVAPGDLEYDQNDAVDFLWTFPLSDFKGDGVYIFVNSGAAWGGDQAYGSAKYFHYTIGQCPVDNGQCTYGYGYWRNHNPIDNPGNQENAWPSSVTELYLGNTSYSIEELVEILNTNVGGNGFVSLAHHLIAAKLNIANGAYDPEIASVIEAADALIGDLQFGTDELSMNEIGDIQAALEAFNEGSASCGEVEEPACIEDVFVELCSSEIDNPTLQGFTNYFRNLVFLNTDLTTITGTFSPSLAELHAQFLEEGPVGTWTTNYTVTVEGCGEVTFEVTAQVNDCE